MQSLAFFQQTLRLHDQAQGVLGGTSHLSLERATESRFSLAGCGWPKRISYRNPIASWSYRSGHHQVSERTRSFRREHGPSGRTARSSRTVPDQNGIPWQPSQKDQVANRVEVPTDGA